MAGRTQLRVAVAGLALAGTLAAGAFWWSVSPAPAISLTTIPPVGEGGPGPMAAIGGLVHGARRGDRVVIFARSTSWFVQPFRRYPYTSIDTAQRWTAATHLGYEYAALLVREDYTPPDRIEKLPSLGGGVRAVATSPGAGSLPRRPAKLLAFSGYEWQVLDAWSDRGGGNRNRADNVDVDRDGALHLRVTQRDREWTSAEIGLARSLGYGTYVFVVRNAAAALPSAVLSLFTWDEGAEAEHFREMNIELGRPGPGDMPGQFVLQPNIMASSLSRFPVTVERTTYLWRWASGVVSFKAIRGDYFADGGRTFAAHEFTTGVPVPKDERVRIALYFHRKSPRPPAQDLDVVIERFHYLP